jgi:hypothetical protein
VKRVKARRDYDGNTHFQGWSRMALPVKSFTVATVAKPNIGENRPAQVIAEVRDLLKRVSPNHNFLGYLHIGIYTWKY